MDTEEIEIQRGDTLMRVLFTILFLLIARVVEVVLLVVIIFELLVSLITKKLPVESVRGFANQAVTYFYSIGRYLTYNQSDPPFPFSEFPPELEPPTWSAAGAESEALGLERDRD